MIGLSNYLIKILDANIQPHALSWLSYRITKIKVDLNNNWLLETFSKVPMVIKPHKLKLSRRDQHWLSAHRTHLNIEDWDTVRLSRVYILNELPTNDRELYKRKIKELFDWAEVKELVALYSALPLLAFPTAWVDLCKEGINSNVGTVQRAIMYYNSFPYEYLDERGWNDMVFEAFNTDKAIHKIHGLADRGNPRLAVRLTAYMEQRIGANQYINPDIEPLITPYLNEKIMKMIEQLLASGDELYPLIGCIICLKANTATTIALLVKYQKKINEALGQDLSWAALIRR